MRVTNPTESKIDMTLNGIAYSIGAKDSKDVSEEIAKHWKEKVHSFVELSEDKPIIKKEEVKVKPEEIKVKEEVKVNKK